MTVLLRRTSRNHLHGARPEIILDVFRQVHLQFSWPAALYLAAPPSPRDEGTIGQAPSPHYS